MQIHSFTVFCSACHIVECCSKGSAKRRFYLGSMWPIRQVIALLYSSPLRHRLCEKPMDLIL